MERHVLATQKVFYYEVRRKAAESHGFTPKDSNEHPGTWENFQSSVLQQKELLVSEETEMLGSYQEM